MPGRDGTGPAGMGSQTGRKAGGCAYNGHPDSFNRITGAITGRGCGRRRHGYQNQFFHGLDSVNFQNIEPSDTSMSEKEMLIAKGEHLKRQIELINTRIDALERADG